MRILRNLAAVAAAGSLGTLPAHSQPSSTAVPENIVVSATAPLLVLGVDEDLVPSSPRVVLAEDLARTHSTTLTDYMDRTLAGVSINDVQANPLQPDIQLRGFVASPLLGQPQGVAVYQDGVRINEPFGDTVNWALIPEAAIKQVTVMPGSSPLFGMNALGGALAIQTKDGFSQPGARAEVLAGDFGRTHAQLEAGGTRGEHFAGYVSAARLQEDGWRDHSPTRSLQLFADGTYRSAQGRIDLSMTRVTTTLVGNGPAPLQLLREDRTAVFTHPDETRNAMQMLSLKASRKFGSAAAIEAVTWHRSSDISSVNGDDTPFAQCNEAPSLLCDAEGNVLEDQFGGAVANDPAVAGATLNRGTTRQTTIGLAAQVSWTHDGARFRNHAALGGVADDSDVHYRSSTELGHLDETRGAIGSGLVAVDAATGLQASLRSQGIYLTETFEATDRLALNAAGRYNVARARMRDQLGTELNGNHEFSRFNPSIGLTYRTPRGPILYASVGQASRAPTPVELTCADPDAPCRLPNAFVSDPPLDQVVSTTLDAGLRSDGPLFDWHLGIFQTINDDDILFISSGALTNEGYFDNVGRTRRRGVEFAVSGRAQDERLDWYANAMWLQATFRTAFEVSSPNHPHAIDGLIEVRPGDRVPGIPALALKCGVDYAVSSRWSIGADLNYSSGQYLRGDEGNQLAPLSGRSVVNLRTDFQVNEHVQLFALLDNATDARYETFGVLGQADEALGAAYSDPRFLSPGAPRALWVGATLQL